MLTILLVECAGLFAGPNAKFGASQNLDSPLLGGTTYYSWFEGEGMLHGTYIEKDGSIWYMNRYVETDSFKMEKELGRKVYLPTMDEKSTPGLRFNRMINLVRDLLQSFMALIHAPKID